MATPWRSPPDIVLTGESAVMAEEVKPIASVISFRVSLRILSMSRTPKRLVSSRPMKMLRQMDC